MDTFRATVVRVKRRSKGRKHHRSKRVVPNQHPLPHVLRSTTFIVDPKPGLPGTFPIQRFVIDPDTIDNQTLRTRSTRVSIRSQRTIGSTPTQRVPTAKPQEKITPNEKRKAPTTLLTILGLITLITIVTTILVVVITTLNINREDTTTTKPTTVPISFNWNTTGITVAGSAVGTPGNTSNSLFEPAGISIDSSGALYITDSRNNRIQKYSGGTNSGTTVAVQIPGACGDPSFLYVPNDVLVAPNGDIYVVDTGCERIRLWANGAVNGTVIAGTGSPGSQLDQLYSPMGIARDSATGAIYVADSINHRIIRYAAGARNGTIAAGGNGAGTGTNQLYQPTSVYFDSSTNSLIIANTLAHNIIRWTLGAAFGTAIAGNANGTPGSSSPALNEPKDVTMDSQGNLYVADYRNNRVQFFRAGQTNGTTIAGIGGGSLSQTLNGPFSIALDSQLNLYVADMNNHRVQKFLRF